MGYCVQWLSTELPSLSPISLYNDSNCYSFFRWSPLPHCLTLLSLDLPPLFFLSHRDSLLRPYLPMALCCLILQNTGSLLGKHLSISKTYAYPNSVATLFPRNILLQASFIYSPDTPDSGDKLISSTKCNAFLETLERLTAEVGSLNHQFVYVGTQVQK